MKQRKPKIFFLAAALSAGFILTVLNDPTAPAYAAKASTKKVAVKGQLHQQTFEADGLKIDFRYVNQKLQDLKISNKSTNPIELTILKQHYILGKNENVVLNLPKMKVLRIYYEPYIGTAADNSMINKVFSDRFKRQLYFELPEHHYAEKK